MREPSGVVYQDRAPGSVLLSVDLSVASGADDPLNRVEAGGALVEQAGAHVDPVDGAPGR